MKETFLLAYIVYKNLLNKYYKFFFKIIKSIHGNFNLIFKFFLNRKKNFINGIIKKKLYYICVS